MAFVPVTYSDGAPVLSSGGTQRQACEHLASWLVAFDALQVARGRGHVTYFQTVGGADASAGTHLCGSAWDMAYTSDAAIADAREMGAAIWHRRPGFNGWPSSGADHVHGVIGCGDNACNGYQITAYWMGYNGLGLNGVGAGDPLPKPATRRTWQEGIAWAQAQINGTTQEDDMAYKTILVTDRPGGVSQQVLISWDGLVGPATDAEAGTVKRVATAPEGDMILAVERDVALAWRTRTSGVAAILAHDSDPSAIAAQIVATLPANLVQRIADELAHRLAN